MKTSQNKECLHYGHDWGSGRYAGVCLRCALGAVDGETARQHNAEQAEEDKRMGQPHYGHKENGDADKV